MESKTQRPRLLILDDDGSVVDYLCESLEEEGYDTLGMTSPVDALSRIKAEDFDLIISDIEMPVLRGVDLLGAILEEKPSQMVLFITAFGSVEKAVDAMRAGACDYLIKPFKIEALLFAIERAFSDRMLRREVVRLKNVLGEPDENKRIIAHSSAMKQVLNMARRAADSSMTVLITGETGNGKTLLARYIHDCSPRREKAFVQLNCAAIPGSLAESELFGVRRGAYTGADEDRDGLFVSADRGTLLLDEIADLPLNMQTKLLHTLETGLVRPLGCDSEISIDTRVIAATNQDLEELLRERKFRSDLYYRINVVRIEVPPLRERKDDIVPLADFLMAQACRQHRRTLVGISAKAIKLLLRHSWPGNVRELANVLERAVAISENDTIMPEDLVFSTAKPPIDPLLEDAVQNRLSLEDLERAHIKRVLEAQGGNKSAAAKLLGITRRTLYRKLEE